MAENKLITRFEKAALFVKNLPKEGDIQPSNDQKLELYSLFKQATIGDNKESKPWAIQIEKSAKWNAWKKLEGLSKDESMVKYIKALKRISKDEYNDK